jgi:hypothetical protein
MAQTPRHQPLASTPGLTADILSALAASLREQRLTSMRDSWRDLALEHGPAVLAVCHPAGITEIEAQLGLDPEARPPWLHMTPHALDETSLFFVKCPCFCHQPSESGALQRLPSECCVCSAAEARVYKG